MISFKKNGIDFKLCFEALPGIITYENAFCAKYRLGSLLLLY